MNVIILSFTGCIKKDKKERDKIRYGDPEGA